ncbi:CHAP domain-containing protein [Parapedobacter sp. 2B3]|uniref:CHAP domain-containing protein n=1 Tax=Parapedobacter sp. 2B3 TaxID=3342381 RepID=UPI0035B63A3F
MATNARVWLPVLIVLLGGSVGGSMFGLVIHAKHTKTLRFNADDAKDFSSRALREIYTAEIGVREATGRNDGPRVAEYLAYCGLNKGYEWCAAFVSWCYGQAGYAQPRNAWAAALFPAGKTIWTKGQGWKGQRKGDVFGIYIASKKRIGHCGFVDAWDGSWLLTVEGNVDNAVVRKRRAVRTIHAVARWTN